MASKTTTEQNTTAIERSQTAMAPASASGGNIGSTTWFTPLADVAETAEAFLFQLDIPGAQPQNVDVSFDRGQLLVQARVAQRQPENARFVWNEYGVGNYFRSFTLETPVDADGIRAELRDGVLSIYVPKAESARTRRIRVQGG
ncbi:MAG: Hsp20/alpha crystallin family protein [Phycisphaerae bacterium]|nr:Hsp20/alpha crystallin family protein [Phycisphaerae bacterium]MDW8261376.1 Hsp20/alpha crystallin family protein [Phycisphaerales bacterium]